MYGTNNSALLDALRFFKGRYYGVAAIDPEHITDDELQELHDAGVRGLRVNFGSNGENEEIADAVKKHAIVAEKFDWVLDLWVPLSAFVALHDYIRDSKVRFVAAHYAHAQVGSKTNQTADTRDPYRSKGFSEVIDLVRSKRLFVKLSAPYQNSNSAPLYEDMRVVAETLIINGPDMVVYGSDWPHTGAKEGNAASGGRLIPQNYRDVNDAALLEILRDWLGHSKQFYRTMVDNPRRLWSIFDDNQE